MRIGAQPSGGTGAGGGGAAGTLDIASAVVAMLPGLVAFFKGLFGGSYQYSTGVRWLTAYYQYYVLGDASATGTHSSTGINEKFTPEAQTWFTAVLGVPIYDRYRLHALMGTEPAAGKPLNNSDEQRVAAYLNPQWTDTQGQDPAKVLRAVQIAKQWKWGTMPGSWAKYGIPADQPDPASEPGGGGGLFPGMGSGNDNLLLWGGVALAAAALYLYYDGDT